MLTSPARLADAEAIDQAVLIANRYQRAFLRLLKAFRDTRRLIGSVIVGEGGTLNVAAGPQQVNLHPPRRHASPPRAEGPAPREDRPRINVRPSSAAAEVASAPGFARLALGGVP